MADEKLIRYLESLVGTPPKLEKMEQEKRKGLPLYLYSRYEFFKWEWLACTTLLAIDNEDIDNDTSPSEYAKHAELLARHFGMPVALVLNHLDSYKRNRLVQYGVPFVMPGNQLFLPPFADLRERFPRLSNTAKPHLPAAAQVVILHHILKKPSPGLSLRELARQLGYSPMTMSNVCTELVEHGLCTGIENKRLRKLHFNAEGRLLWEKAKPLLTSPVRKRIWLRFSRREGNPLLKAGISALSDCTMLSDDPLPCFACRESALHRMVERGEVIGTGGNDTADCQVEAWKYEPETLGDVGRVDCLSLYLSLADSPDERVQSSLESLLETARW